MKRKFLLTAIAVMTAIHSVAATTFVIGTYNIRLRTLSDKTDDPATDKYWDNRCDNVAQTIRDGAFDILAINEMTDDASTDGRTMFADMQGYFPAPEYAFVTQPGAKNTLAAILYRTELFEVLEKGSFWLGPDPYNYSTDVWDHGNFGRMSLWAKFRVKTTGEVFFVMVTHLHHQGNISKNEGSAQNVDAMRAIAGGCPAFICGDHNSTASREPFYKLYGAYFDDSYVVAAHTDGSGGTCNVWNSTSLSRLDYVWVRGAVVNDYSTIQNKYDKDFYPSDHFPVRAEVSLCPPVEVRVRYVDASAADGGIGSIDAPFKLLQDAIDASGRGDTILVAEGSYFPTFVPSTTNAKATFNIERSLTIIGGYDSDFASVCGRSVLSGDLDGNDIVSADDATNVVTIGSSASVEMANIEVCGGVAKAQKGAGIQCNGPRLVLENVYVHDNSSNNMGGGVYAYGQIKAHGCVFERNVTTANGGAVYVDTNGSSMPWSHRFDGCRFSGNKALGGAAICVQSTMWLSVINNCFDSNVSTARGALTVTGNKTYSTVSITNNTFANNVLASANTSGNASKGGAAIYMQNLL
ncbi:MAG: endonuclease/exonuclease/phosphatase family protein, partial [Muribaculaceae bacterium]